MIGPSQGPLDPLRGGDPLRSRRQREPFPHGQTPQSAQEEQWVEALDRRRRLEGMPHLHVLINALVFQGYELEKICALLKVSPMEVSLAVQACSATTRPSKAREGSMSSSEDWGGSGEYPAMALSVPGRVGCSQGSFQRACQEAKSSWLSHSESVIPRKSRS
jgi:hypothetical protein